MSPSAPSVVLALLLAPPAAFSGVALSVTGDGSLEGGILEVRVNVANAGSTAARPLALEGELLSLRDDLRIEGGVPAGGSRTAFLHFPLASVSRGTYAVLLHLRYPAQPGTAGPEEVVPAYFPLGVGGASGDAVHLGVGEARLTTYTETRISLESADSRPHRVRLRVETPTGLAAPGFELGKEASVPAGGHVEVALPLLRAGAAWGTASAFLVLASTVGEDEPRTSVALGRASIARDPEVLPRLRLGLLALGGLLLLTTFLLEWGRREAES